MYHAPVTEDYSPRLYKNVCRILVILCLVFFFIAAVLGISLYRNQSSTRSAMQQFEQRMVNAAASAIDEVNRMSSSASSNMSVRLTHVRQYVYFMKQLNEMSIAVSGEGARLAPDVYFTTLEQDLDLIDTLMQTSTSSTFDARSDLLEHLQKLQQYVMNY